MKAHPYLADLPIFEAEVEAIAESIAEVGLIHPITLDAEGQVIGGRHRLAACEKAGVEPTFETYDGDPLAFMAHDNAARKHQTPGQIAAEQALVLANAGRRDGGRWVGWSKLATDVASSAGERKARERCGLIFDYLGRDALIAIANGDRVLHDAHEEAKAIRDEHLRKRVSRA